MKSRSARRFLSSNSSTSARDAFDLRALNCAKSLQSERPWNQISQGGKWMAHLVWF